MNERETLVEKSRREVADIVAKSSAAAHRALDAKYNIIRHSERRWRVVRVASVATLTFGIEDVITFEYVSEALPFAEALKALADKRGTKTSVQS